MSRATIRRCILIVSSAAVAATAGEARAQTSSSAVLVLPTQANGILFERSRLQKLFDDRVAAGVQQQATVVSLRDELPCYEASCLARLAEKYGVNAVAWASVSLDKKRPPDYHLKVNTFNRDDEQIEAKEETCRTAETETGVCGERQAGEALQTMASLVRPHSLATTSAQIQAPHANEPNVIVSARTDAPKPIAPLPSSERRMSRGALIGLGVLAGAGLAGGLALTSVGAAGLALDGKPTCSGPLSQCPRVYDTSVMGGALVGVGVAVLVASTVALIFDVRALKRRDRITLLPLVGPSTYGLSFGGAL